MLRNLKTIIFGQGESEVTIIDVFTKQQEFKHIQETGQINIIRLLDSLIWEPPCIFNRPNLGTLARCFPTLPIWNLGFFQPSIMKNYNSQYS
jgi:hypothetical protein